MRVAGEDRHAHAGAVDEQVGEAEDLPALVAPLLLLVGLAEPSSTTEPASGTTLKAIGAANLTGAGELDGAEPS